MSMLNFIQTANQLGATKTPFFFLIDFEQNKPLIYPLTTLEQHKIWFKFPDKSNAIEQSIAKKFELTFTPMERSLYQEKFHLVKKEIQNGNSYLLNLTVPTPIQTNYTLAEIFQASRAKYKLLLDDHFVCFSPECFIKIENNRIYSYPMKGTINVEEENALEKLLNSEKELAEHNTIVDLIRNDLALVAQNIQVTKYRYVEQVNTHKGAIYQTSSEIRGELPLHWQNNIGNLLEKILPAGSISGAPKVKTVEIIQQAEKQERGYYTGIFGYFDGDALDSAVAIRYIENDHNQFIFRSGGGITALSQCDDEYNEILEKIYVPLSTI
ncbi:aminodeoxychorismate synthase subunit I [Otariodibacter oris]|uniref:Aminodeoxychorismate synthase subunit I n=2 Tax=Otariodibacter oris TaxID=1032623 RepID=A0A420XEL9_9PAST|nr:aminodeoxychorismate synthase subunit I [Otariodibacter oris]